MLVFVFGILLLNANPSSIAVQAQTGSPSIWLAVEDDFATLIKNELGSDYTYLDKDPLTLLDDINRQKIAHPDEMPDAIIGWNKFLPNLVIKNLIEPISEDRLSSVHVNLERGVSFFEVQENSAFSTTILDGTVELYGYPVAAQSTMLVVNGDIVDTDTYPLDTLEEFATAALQNNDQRNPSTPIFGMGMETVIDPMLWMYYGYDGLLFQDDIVDIPHLIVNEETSINALGEINTLINIRKLNPKIADRNPFEVFTEDKNLGILITDLNSYDIIVDNASLGPSNVELYNAGGGAPLYSYSVMVPSDGDSSIASDIADVLYSDDFQGSVFSAGLIPVNSVGISATSASNAIQKEMNDALDDALSTPIDPLWREIKGIFENQLTKLRKGDQNHTRTALATDVALRIILKPEAQWGVLPQLITESTSSTDETPYGRVWFALIAIMAVGVIRKRRN